MRRLLMSRLIRIFTVCLVNLFSIPIFEILNKQGRCPNLAICPNIPDFTLKFTVLKCIYSYLVVFRLNMCRVMLLCLFIAALSSPTGEVLTSWLLFVIFNCVFVTFLCGTLGQMRYLIVSIPNLCHLSYFYRLPCIIYESSIDHLESAQRCTHMSHRW